MSPLFRGGRGQDEEPAGPRSAEDREAARLERERRRAEREGGSSEPAWGSDPLSLPDADPVSEATHGGLTPEPAPAQPGAWAPDPEPVPDPVTVPFEPAHEAQEAEPAQEEPTALRRAPAPSVRDLPEVAGPRPARAPRPRGVPRRRRGVRRLFALLVLAAVLALAWFAYRVFQPFADDGDASRPVALVVPPGSTADEVADLLQERGVIDSAFFFKLRVRVEGKRGDLKAGRFTLRRDMSYAAAIDALSRSPQALPTTKLTVPEGRSIGEEAPILRRAGLKGSYLKAADRNPRAVTGFTHYGVPRGTSSLEGFLFPATYDLKKGATARDLVAAQLGAFKRNFDGLDQKAAKRKNLSAYDVLIIASMIEREAQVPKDRALISAVIYNRLKQHIPLGIDATLRYRLGNWSRPLRQSELQTDSAFNTRLHQGLPPTPIGSPGLASIKAALAPARKPYLFYVVKPCGNGAHAFSSTDAQFTKDVQAYNRKRAQLGGKDPSHC